MGPKECTWQQFAAQLKAEEPCWTVYHFAYQTKDNAKRNKTILLQWIPSRSNIKLKMQYAMWTNVLKTSLTGIHCHIQAGDEADIDYEAVLEKVARFERDEM